MYARKTYLCGWNFGPLCSTTKFVFEIQDPQKSEMHWMTRNWTRTLRGQNYSIYTNDLPQSPQFLSVSFYNQWFSRYMYKVTGNQKFTEWPQTEHEHLTVKSPCIHLILTLEVQILVCFALRLAVSKIQGRQKSEMYRMTPKLNLNI